MSIPYYDCIAHHATRRPDSLAAVDLATGRHHTYQAFNERIARLAGSLRRNHGIAVGDRVAILAPNTTARSTCNLPAVASARFSFR